MEAAGAILEEDIALSVDVVTSSTSTSTSESVPCEELAQTSADHSYTLPENIPLPSELLVGADWAKLPSVILTSIYGYTSDADRASMSRVCHHWKESFTQPCLWRYRKYSVGGFRARVRTLNIYPILGFARNFGKHLRYMYISVEHPALPLTKKFHKTFVNYLSQLMWAETQLREFSLLRLHADRYWRNEYPREGMLSAFANFLNTQVRLEFFDMSDAALSIQSGLKMLDSVTEYSGRKLKVVNIEDFFQSRVALQQVTQLQRLMSRFRAVTSLYLNYNYLSEDTLSILSQNCQKKLNFLSIKVYKSDPHLHKISNLSWKLAKRACPRLRVNVYFEGVAKHDVIKDILSREMPLTSVQIWTGTQQFEVNWQLPTMLKYLGDSFSNTIEEMTLGLENGSESIDEAVIYMLSKLKRIESLDLQAIILVSTVETICQMQEEYKIANLSKFFVTCKRLTNEQVKLLEDMIQKYVHIYVERKHDFQLSVAHIRQEYDDIDEEDI